MTYKTIIKYRFELREVIGEHIRDGWAVFMIHEIEESRAVVTFIKNDIPHPTKP